MKTLPDARWSCGSCGACCRGFRFGPIEEEVITNLREKEVEKHWSPAVDGWCDQLQTPNGPVWMFRNRPDGSCIFLQEDQRCAIHARWGSEAKPGFCREFPYQVLKTGTDTVVSLRGECAGLWHSFQDGEPVEEQAEAVSRLPRVVPVQQHHPALLPLLPGKGVEEATFERLEAIFLREMKGKEPEAAITAVRDALERAYGRPLPRVPNAEEPLAHLLGRLEELYRKAAEDPQLELWQRESMGKVWRLLSQARKGRVCRLEGDAIGYLDLLQRSSIISRSWVPYGSLAAGLGRLLLDAAIVRRCGPEGLGARAVAAIHVPWLKASGHPVAIRVLKEESDTLVALFLGSRSLIPAGSMAEQEKAP